MDAQFIKNLIEEFDKIVSEAKETIGDILGMIGQIALAADEGAHGTVQIAGKISDIGKSSDDIKDSVERVKELIPVLEECTKMVKVKRDI